MNRAMRFRIKPDKKQEELFARTFGCCRFLYNRMLAERKTAGEAARKEKRTPASYKKEYPWLKEVDSLALCNAQLDFEEAFRNYYNRKDTGFPRYKTKHHSRQSYTTNVVNGNIRVEGKRIRLPKAGMVRIKVHREIPEGWRLKAVTVVKEPSGRYYASLLFEVPERENQTEGAEEKERKYLGIDYAMDGLAVMSDGTRADYPKFYRKAEGKLKREQRKLSHCEKGSRNYRKQKQKVAIIHEKIRNQRKDYLHKLSRRLADTYDVIGVEDIDMRAMSRSLHFGKNVMDNGFGMLRSMLGYKLEGKGKRLIKADKFFPSSKKCSVCGKIRKDLMLSDRVYLCSCGNCLDRDVNAAINIRMEAIRLTTA